MTVYLKNQSDFAAMNDVYKTYWTKDPPARTTVMVPLLNEGLIEIAAVAVPDGGNRVVVNPSEWAASRSRTRTGSRPATRCSWPG
jgi:hypothetical protein